MNALKTDLLASDVMVREPVCVEPSTTIRQLAMIFEENEISGAPVVNQEGVVIGVVSKTDLIRRCSEGSVDMPPSYLFEVISEQSGMDDEDNPSAISEPLVCVEDFMTEDPMTVTPTTPVTHIAKLMHERHIHRVIVVDNERYPVGIITSMDLLGVMAKHMASK